MRRGSGLGLLLQKHEFGGFDTKFRSVYSITSCICFCKSAHQPQTWSAFAISGAIISQLYVISNLTKSIIPDRNRSGCATAAAAQNSHTSPNQRIPPRLSRPLRGPFSAMAGQRVQSDQLLPRPSLTQCLGMLGWYSGFSVSLLPEFTAFIGAVCEVNW